MSNYLGLIKVGEFCQSINCYYHYLGKWSSNHQNNINNISEWGWAKGGGGAGELNLSCDFFPSFFFLWKC